MPNKQKPAKVYLVIRGKKPGIYRSAETYLEQIRMFPGCLAKGFTSAAKAIEWKNANDPDNILDEKDIRKAFLLRDQEKYVQNPTPPIQPVITDEGDIRRVCRSPLKIYTDGSIAGKETLAGGYAGVVVLDDKIALRIKGRKKKPGKDSRHIELVAVSKVLKYLEKHQWNLNDASIYTDCQYIADAWIKNRCPDTPYRKLWKKTWRALVQYNISVCWTKGHIGNPCNEECDRLAKQAAHEQLALATAKKINKKKKEEVC